MKVSNVLSKEDEQVVIECVEMTSQFEDIRNYCLAKGAFLVGYANISPQQQIRIELYGMRKAILLNGFYWGLAHLPLIYLGFNYSLDNVGAPWSNMAMMMLVCMTIGIICCYVMVRSNNVI